MAKITIVGSGITGMACASMLSRTHDVTIIARNLPGDPDSTEWSSPWAGAMFLPTPGITPREQQMQRDTFAIVWELAESHPESGIQKVELHDSRELFTIDNIWYKDLMPEFRVKDVADVPEGCLCSMVYRTVVLPPPKVLPWLAQHLKDRGVKFMRATLGALSDLKPLGSDVIINASGLGARDLRDVADKAVHPVRGQTALVRTDWDKVVTRYGKGSTYTIPRLDGTAILGGFKHPENLDPTPDLNMRLDAIRRATVNSPGVFTFIKDKPENIEIVRDIVGFRPERHGGIRVENEVIDGQKIVHAYGVGGTGYIFSFGLARAVSGLVDEFLYAPQTKL